LKEFIRRRLEKRSSNPWMNQPNIEHMKTKYTVSILAAAGLAALATGCAEPQPAYVPAYQPPAQTAVVEAPSAPPVAQVEVVPVAPGPQYVWVPGYLSWNGNWV
jgi:hypothetical protein